METVSMVVLVQSDCVRLFSKVLGIGLDTKMWSVGWFGLYSCQPGYSFFCYLFVTVAWLEFKRR